MDERFTNYIHDNHITYDDYQQNQFKYYMSFMEFIGCKINIISFADQKMISDILSSKYALQHEFWNKEAFEIPYPGRKSNL